MVVETGPCEHVVHGFCHKVRVLERILDRYGAYLNHLITLSEDPGTKSADKQKLKGYIIKWRNCRILLGCALFHDILKPVAVLCKCLQADELCIVSAIEAILRTTASIKRYKTLELNAFPSVKKVLDRIKPSNTHVYQGVEIVQYDETLAFLNSNYRLYIDLVLTCLRNRIKEDEVSDASTLTHALKILATHGWEKTTEASFGHEAIQHLQQRFATPLQKANVNCALLEQEWDNLLFLC